MTQFFEMEFGGLSEVVETFLLGFALSVNVQFGTKHGVAAFVLRD
jgi:hypothetical protein